MEACKGVLRRDTQESLQYVTAWGICIWVHTYTHCFPFPWILSVTLIYKLRIFPLENASNKTVSVQFSNGAGKNDHLLGTNKQLKIKTQVPERRTKLGKVKTNKHMNSLQCHCRGWGTLSYYLSVPSPQAAFKWNATLRWDAFSETFNPTVLVLVRSLSNQNRKKTKMEQGETEHPILTFSLICSGIRSAWYVNTTGSQYLRPSCLACFLSSNSCK